jgi:hypothetical protein
MTDDVRAYGVSGHDKAPAHKIRVKGVKRLCVHGVPCHGLLPRFRECPVFSSSLNAHDSCSRWSLFSGSSVSVPHKQKAPPFQVGPGHFRNPMRTDATPRSACKQAVKAVILCAALLARSHFQITDFYVVRYLHHHLPRTISGRCAQCKPPAADWRRFPVCLSRLRNGTRAGKDRKHPYVVRLSSFASGALCPGRPRFRTQQRDARRHRALPAMQESRGV